MKWYLLIWLVLLGFAHADISFELNQSEFYFPLGSEAIIPLNTSSTYEQAKSGQLTSIVRQEVVQANSRFSNSNTQSAPFTVQPGDAVMGLNFGSSNDPMTLTVDLKFKYDLTKEITLTDIQIFFVQDPSQQQQQSESKQSQESAAQQESQAQEKLQNQQSPQDSSALQKQIQEEFAQEQQMQEQLSQAIQQNEEFQNAVEQLQEQGYEPQSLDTQPNSSDTGEFEATFEKPNGETASLSGSMQNGLLESLTEEKRLSDDQLLSQLQNNSKFQKYNSTLQKEGFSPQNVSISEDQITAEYLNEQNETARIVSSVQNNTISNVSLERPSKGFPWWFIGIALIVLVALLYWKPKEHTTVIEPEVFNYREQSLGLLEQAQKEYVISPKEAFSLVGQGLRLYLRYTYGLSGELTNDEMIRHLRHSKKPYKNVKECFDLCSLVEFAKYKSEKKDFDKAYKIAKKVIE